MWVPVNLLSNTKTQKDLLELSLQPNKLLDILRGQVLLQQYKHKVPIKFWLHFGEEMYFMNVIFLKM